MSDSATGGEGRRNKGKQRAEPEEHELSTKATELLEDEDEDRDDDDEEDDDEDFEAGEAVDEDDDEEEEEEGEEEDDEGEEEDDEDDNEDDEAGDEDDEADDEEDEDELAGLFEEAEENGDKSDYVLDGLGLRSGNHRFTVASRRQAILHDLEDQGSDNPVESRGIKRSAASASGSGSGYINLASKKHK